MLQDLIKSTVAIIGNVPKIDLPRFLTSGTPWVPPPRTKVNYKKLNALFLAGGRNSRPVDGAPRPAIKSDNFPHSSQNGRSADDIP